MTKTWDKHKAAIVALYKAENRPLHEVQTIMRERFNFEASIRAYRTRFGKWGLQKYNARRRHSVATYLARPRLEKTSPSPRTLGMARSISQTNVSRNTSMPSLSTVPAMNSYNQYPAYLSPDSSELPSSPIKFEDSYRPAIGDVTDDSCSNYTTYGSESSLYYLGSSQSGYSPRSAAIPSPHVGYSEANMTLLDAIRHDDKGMLCQILGSCAQASSAYAHLTFHGSTPLHIAVNHRALAVLPQLLLVSGSPSTQDLNGDTPAHCLFRETGWWREEKLVAMAQELLGRTDVNIRNSSGESPFDVAFTQLQPLALNACLEHAAPNVSLGLPAGSDGNLPLDVVMATILDRLMGSKTGRYGSVEPEGWERAAECLCALLEAGAHPESRLNGVAMLPYLLSRPAAETEAFGRLYEFTHRLATKLADAAAPDSRGLTALDYALLVRPHESIVAQQRQVIQILTERCRFTERHRVRRASTDPSSLITFATQWSTDEGFLELSMRLVAARADTSTLIPTTCCESFSEELMYLVSVSQADGERDGRGPYGLESHAHLDSLQSEVAPGVPLGAAIWISACNLDSWNIAREHLRALEKLMPRPPCPTQRFHDEALRVLSTKFLDSWAKELRALASLRYASPDPKARQVAAEYLGVLAFCAARGEHAQPEKRHYDLVSELPAFFSLVTDEYHHHPGFARA